MTLPAVLRPRLLMPCLLFMAVGLSPASALAQTPVRVQAVEAAVHSLVEEVPLTGSVVSPRVSRVSTQVAGLVRRLHADAGDRVRAGDLLLELDDELRRLDRDRARAEAERARAQWEDSQRLLREGRRLSEDAMPASEVRGLEARERIARAEREAANAALAGIEAELERHRLRAPFDGVLSARMAADGEWVSPGDQLFELVATAPLYIDFQVPQRYYPRIDGNDHIQLRFDAYPAEHFVGEIHSKVPLSREGARTFLLRVVLPADGEEAGGQQPLLIPGMSSSASLRLDADKRALAVPRDALVRYADGRQSLWVADAAEWGASTQVQEQPVSTGDTYAGRVEILDGLQPGQLVITRGNESLREGQRVILQRGDAPSNGG